MTFDFFNTSNLAFGKKITAAFTQLENIAQSAENNVDSVLADALQVTENVGKNYLAPAPFKNGSPVRLKEVTDLLLNNRSNLIKLKINNDKKLEVTYLVVNTDTGLITFATGTSKEILAANTTYYVYYKKAISNSSPVRDINVVKDKKDAEDNEILLVTLTTGTDADIKNDIFDVEYPSLETLNRSLNGYKRYSSLSYGKQMPLEFTADKYAGYLIIGKYVVNAWVRIYKNNVEILRYSGAADNWRYGLQQSAFLYLKPGDKIRGENLSAIYELNYNEYKG